MNDFDLPLQPCLAAKSLAVIFSEEKGRCLIASRHFSRGEVILEQEPYVSVLDAESKEKRCDSCFTESSKLMRCSACKNVWYCSSTCQKKVWKLHQAECAAIVKLWKEKQHKPTPSLTLMVRLFLRRKLQEEKVIPRTAMDHYGLVEALLSHMSKTEEERLVLYAQMANLVKLLGVPDNINVKLITENFCRLACNAHTICDEELRPLGTGLYPLISIVNHSCSPNLVLLFEGKRAVLRAVENVKEGSELTVSYVELGASTSSRRATLRAQYFFHCNCLRCSRGDCEEDAMLEGYRCSDLNCAGTLHPSAEAAGNYACHFCGTERSETDLRKLASKSERLLQTAASLTSSGKTKEARKAYERAEEEQLKVWHPYSVFLMRSRDSLMKLCMDTEDWRSALHYAKLTLPVYERIYPPYFPLLGLELYFLAKLEWFLGHTSEAVTALTRAHEILGATHGVHSRLFQGLSQLLGEARAEAAHVLQRG